MGKTLDVVAVSPEEVTLDEGEDDDSEEFFAVKEESNESPASDVTFSSPTNLPDAPAAFPWPNRSGGDRRNGD